MKAVSSRQGGCSRAGGELCSNSAYSPCSHSSAMTIGAEGAGASGSWTRNSSARSLDHRTS